MSNNAMIMEATGRSFSVSLADNTENTSDFCAPSRPVLSFHPKSVLARLASASRVRTYLRGEVVFSQGAQADAVFWMLSGEVKLTVVSPQGKEAVIAILPEGSFFGEECLAGRFRRMATAQAMCPAKIVAVSRQTMFRMLYHEPEFAVAFMDFLLSRHVRLEEDLLDQLFNSSEKRLARLLLLMAHFDEEGEPLHVIANINHETLAEMIGTTRSRVTFFMNRFRKCGFIEYDHGVRVHRSLLNVVLRD